MTYRYVAFTFFVPPALRSEHSSVLSIPRWLSFHKAIMISGC